MKHLPPFVALLLAVFLGCSSDSQVAGTVTDTGNPTVTARIVTPDGQSAPGVPVSLLPDTYSPARDPDSVVLRDTTDGDGRYLFPEVGKGVYSILARDGSGACVLRCSVVPDSTLDTMEIPDDTLRPAGAVRVAGEFTAGSWVFIPGTDCAIPVDSAAAASGEVLLTGVPSGPIPYVNTLSSTGTAATLAQSVAVPSGDTTVASTALPIEIDRDWKSASVGEVPVGGVAWISDMILIAGGGPDIYDKRDGFHFLCTPATGPMQMTVKLLGHEDAVPFAKAGIMAREAIGPSAPFAAINCEAQTNSARPFIVFMQSRAVQGDTVSRADSIMAARPPLWLRMRVTGDTATGSWSADSSAWSTIGTVWVPGLSAGKMGLCVSSHDTTALNIARFEGLVVEKY